MLQMSQNAWNHVSVFVICLMGNLDSKSLKWFIIINETRAMFNIKWDVEINYCINQICGFSKRISIKLQRQK